MAYSPVTARTVTLGGQALPLVSPARIYLCGITPYDVTHLGHAATMVWVDAAISIMGLAGIKAIVCRNVTDIDDHLTRAAAEHDSSYDEFAATQEYLFERDMAALGVRRPTHSPRARHFVDQVIQLAWALLESGHGYERDGQVYFRGYPAIPGGPPAQDAEHGELTAGPDRAEPFDVAVWRTSGPGDPAWPSPWGPGRPGWHAECAAIAMSVLGAGVDLVAGGADLAFPHHAYQAALVEAASGARPFARSHLSVGTVGIGGQKMAKSTGNLVLISDLLQEHSAAAIRLLLLDRDWRQPWDYQPEDLRMAAERLGRLYSAGGRHNEPRGAADAVRSALLRELDVPAALDIAEEAGGDAVRLLLHTLTLG